MNPPVDSIAAGAGTIPPRLAAPRPVVGAGIAIASAAFLLVAVALFVFNPAEHAFYPRCFFHQWTGLQCPGCGGLRAAHQLLHGHLPAALHHNAFAVLGLPFAGWLLGREWVRRRHGTGAQPFVSTRLVWGGLAALLIFAILRNLPAFAFLSP